MGITIEQQKIIDRFRQKYFAVRLIKEKKIGLGEFLAKTTVEKIKFIQQWAIKRYNNLLVTESNLNIQINKVQKQRAIVKKALLDWNIGE